MGMVELCDGASFAHETFGHGGGGMGGVIELAEEFDGDVSGEGGVMGEINNAHAAFADFAEEAIGSEGVLVAHGRGLHTS